MTPTFLVLSIIGFTCGVMRRRVLFLATFCTLMLSAVAAFYYVNTYESSGFGAADLGQSKVTANVISGFTLSIVGFFAGGLIRWASGIFDSLGDLEE